MLGMMAMTEHLLVAADVACQCCSIAGPEHARCSEHKNVLLEILGAQAVNPSIENPKTLNPKPCSSLIEDPTFCSLPGYENA